MMIVKGIAAIALCSLLLFGCAGSRPKNLGVTDGRLSPCPDSPNCVNSQAGDGHFIAPLAVTSAPDLAWPRLLAVLDEMPRVKIVTQRADYLHAEFTSLVFRFVDDVEFYFDPAAGVIHVRSASRLGHSDLGANRKRIEEIRKRLARR